jgi:4-amino-4-deoxy-L-arabinose transferase-like glycosyltransferase
MPIQFHQSQKTPAAAPGIQLRTALIIVLVSRVLFALIIWKVSGPSGFFSPDTGSYLPDAQSLLHGSFSNNGIPEIYRTPGYPLLLAGAVALGHPVIVGLLENFLLSVASALLIWQITKHLCTDIRAAGWAVLLYCFEPLGLAYSEKLLTETLFSTLLLLFLWLLLRFYFTPGYKGLLFCSLALSASAYVRPVTLYLGLWLLSVLFLFPRSQPRTLRVMRAVVFVIVFELTLLPWVIRMAKVGGYAGFSPASDFISYFYYSAAIRARLEHKSIEEVRDQMGYEWNPAHELYFHRHPEQRTWSDAQIYRFEGSEARKLISQHRLLYVWLHLKGCAVLMLDPGVTDLLKPLNLYREGSGLLSRLSDEGLIKSTWWFIRSNPAGGVLLVVLGAQLALYYLFGLRGLFHIPTEPRMLLIWLLLYLILVSGGPAGLARYRLPIMSLVCIAAGAGIAGKRKSIALQKASV